MRYFPYMPGLNDEAPTGLAPVEPEISAFPWHEATGTLSPVTHNGLNRMEG
jgi:hypothetical protein